MWSPDGSKVLLVIKDQDFSDTAKTKVHKPFVMDRYHFKQDYIGYLDSGAIHLYLLNIETQKIDTLIKGIYDETEPVWSPDGKQIAFTSNRTENPDKNENTDIYLMDAVAGGYYEKINYLDRHRRESTMESRRQIHCLHAK